MTAVHHVAPSGLLTTEHRFVDIREDLAPAVVFGPPEGELA